MRVLKVPRKMCIKPLLRDRNAARRSLATFGFPLDFLGCGGGGGGRCSAGAAGSGFGIRTPQNGVYEEGGGWLVTIGTGDAQPPSIPLL